MKKATIFILLGIISCLLLSACSILNNGDSLETTSDGIVLEPHKQNLPTADIFQQIKGIIDTATPTTYEEVVALIGNPQRVFCEQSLGQDQYIYIYDTSNGTSFSISFVDDRNLGLVVGSVMEGDYQQIIEQNTTVIDENAVPWNIPLEPNKQNLPSFDELKKIEIGMTPDEVYALVGNPQRVEIQTMAIDPNRSIAFPLETFVYEATNGECIYVLYMALETDLQKPMVSNFLYSSPD